MLTSFLRGVLNLRFAPQGKVLFCPFFTKVNVHFSATHFHYISWIKIMKQAFVVTPLQLCLRHSYLHIDQNKVKRDALVLSGSICIEHRKGIYPSYSLSHEYSSLYFHIQQIWASLHVCYMDLWKIRKFSISVCSYAQHAASDFFTYVTVWARDWARIE